jgi:nucleotide-binding universal stress UspA family protein
MKTPQLRESAVMFKHILLPTDGSKLSEKSVKQGIRMAKQLGAAVTAVHVIPKAHVYDYQMQLLTASEESLRADDERRAEQCLRFVKKAAAGADVQCETLHLISDQPYKAIVNAAKRKDCDLILMASHGRRGIEGFLLGSETQKVLTHSTIPVLVYR